MGHFLKSRECSDLDSVSRYEEIKRVLEQKKCLRELYSESYQRFAQYLKQCKAKGLVLEIGSGAGFAKQYVPELITSDVIAYPHLDKVVDATALPFSDGSLKAVLLYNVLHHIPDAEKCFQEISRCLAPGGIVYIVDPYPGLVHLPIMKYIHHEGFDAKTPDWKFQSEGPLSSANGALAWILFERDKKKFQTLYPNLKMQFYNRHSPLRYFLSGGFMKWTLTPDFLIPFTTWLDKFLVKISPRFASFLEIGLVKEN